MQATESSTVFVRPDIKKQVVDYSKLDQTNKRAFFYEVHIHAEICRTVEIEVQWENDLGQQRQHGKGYQSYIYSMYAKR